MKKIVLFTWLTFFLFSCKPSGTVSEEGKSETAITSENLVTGVPGLKKLWDTETVLTTSESVLYDKNNNLLYVSCINGVPPTAKDNDGFISKVGLDGKIIELKWVTGLSAPKGMGLIGQTLYVTDIDRLVAIDINTGKISNTWSVDGASFLNDVTTTNDGKVYFTDSNTSKIHSLIDNKISVVYAEESLGGPNGVIVEGNMMYFPSMNEGIVFSLNLDTKELRKVAVGIPAGDGIARYGDALIVSSWNGEIYHVDPANGTTTNILDSKEAKLNAADFEIIPEKNLILIPTFFGNGVTAYEFIPN